MQDKHEPLKFGRFVLSKGNHFASTSATLQCHAYTTCFIVLVVPKGNTIDQICAPRDVYKVLKRIPLRQRRQSPKKDVSSGLSTSVRPKEEEEEEEEEGHKLNSDSELPSISYDGRQDVADDKMQVSTVVVTPTVTWPDLKGSIGDQKPKPVNACEAKTSKPSTPTTLDLLTAPVGGKSVERL